MRIKAIVIAVALCLALPACSSMRVNGLSLSGLSSGNNGQESFCQEHKGLCVAGVLIGGAIIAGIISNQRDGNRNSSEGGQPPPPPGCPPFCGGQE